MKIKKQITEKSNIDIVKKKKKNKENGVPKIEVGNGQVGAILKKNKTKGVEKVNGHKGTNDKKGKNKKLEQILEKSEVLKDVKKTKKDKKASQSDLVTPIVAVKKNEKKNDVKKKKTLLDPEMTSSEILNTLNSLKPSKKSKLKNKEEITQVENKLIDAKPKNEIVGKKSKNEVITKKSKNEVVAKKPKKEVIDEKNEEEVVDKKPKKAKFEKENNLQLIKPKKITKSDAVKAPEDETKKIGKKTKIGKMREMLKIKKEKKQSKNATKKLKAKNKPVPSLEEAPKFDEENFNSIINLDNISKTVKALKKLLKKETATSKNVIFEDYRYLLNLGLFKIPSAPKRDVKLKLKHSLVGPEDDVLFIVKDLKRGMKVDYEPTVHYYEDLLREKGIEGIKTIMPFNQIKKEYGSYEMKRKLSNLYEYFLCDGAIVGHVFGILGKIFSTKQRCTLHAVRTGNLSNLKSEINKALKRTNFKQGSKGNTISICVGNDKHTIEQVAENILKVLEQLKTLLPGGHPNIRNIMVRVNLKGTSSLPLYLNMGKPPNTTPFIIGTKEQKLNKLKEKAEEILQKFTFTNEGMIEKISPEEVQARKRKREEREAEAAAEIPKKKKSIKDKLAKKENEGEKNLLNEEKKKKSKKENKVEEILEIEAEDSESEDDPDFEPENENDPDLKSDSTEESDEDDDDDEIDDDELKKIGQEDSD